MHHTILYENSSIHFSDKGNGTVIVLLHGYMESIETWGAFASDLEKNFRVIAIDLPGHGKSRFPEKEKTIELMADAVAQVLIHCSIEKCFMLGHSMGGYVTLAFVEKHSEMLTGFCLLHSSPFADSKEKRENRDREIALVRKGKKAMIYDLHCQNVFSVDNHERFAWFIEQAKIVAKNTSDEGIIAALEAMKVRKDRSDVLSATKLPFLYVIGRNDIFISLNILDKITMPVNGEILFLNHSGHNGFIEERITCVDQISQFIVDACRKIR